MKKASRKPVELFSRIKKLSLWRFFSFKNKVFTTLFILVVLAAVFCCGIRYERYCKSANARDISSQIGKTNKKSATPTTTQTIATGTVEKISTSSITIKEANGTTQELALDAKLTVVSGGKSSKIDAVKIGNSVRVYIRKAADGTKTVGKISVLSSQK